MMTTPQVLFGRSGHTYEVSGRNIKSVTSIMRDEGAGFGWSKDNNGAIFGTVFHEVMKIRLLDEKWRANEEYRKPYREDDEGNEVSLSNDVEWFFDDESCKDWIAAIDKFIRDQQPKHQFLEHIVYSERYGFAGTLDFFGSIKKYGDELVLIDWKTWANPTPPLVAMSGLQTAAYEMALRQQEDIHWRIRRLAVHFSPNMYKILPLNNPADFPAFQSCMNWNRWKEQNL